MNRVLLVEADPGLARIAHPALRSAGYDVMHAWSGSEALALLGRLQRPPAVIVVDIAPLTVDGRHTLNALRVDSRFAEIPVVVVTANVITGLTDRDAAHTLRKPYSGQDLLTAVRVFAPI